MGTASTRSVTSWPNPTVLPSGSYTNVVPFGINDAGQIVGYASTSSPWMLSGWTAIFWASPTSPPTALPCGTYSSSNGYDTSAVGINNAGQIVGKATASWPTASVPLFWASPTSAPTPLNSGAYTYVQARGISNGGHIVGLGSQLYAANVPLWWASPTSEPATISTMFSSPYQYTMEPYSINSATQVVGVGNTGGPDIPFELFTIPPALVHAQYQPHDAAQGNHPGPALLWHQ